MTVRSSAPGKILICGEYGVLSGEPALVMTVKQRVQVTLTAASNWQLYSDGGEPEPPPETDFLRHSQRPQHPVTLALWAVARTLGCIPEPLTIHIDSRQLQQQGTKLGLGSSAAVSVALTAAVAQHVGLEMPSLGTCFRVHDLLQGTSGSGFDVAAAWHGGWFGFRRQGNEAVVEALPAPPAPLCFVWTGQAARTSGFVTGYRQWERRDPNSADVIRRLGHAASMALRATREQNTSAFVDALADASGQLERLAQAASLPIFAGGHDLLLDLGRRHGVAYKPCGAGGGDLGLAAGMDPGRLAAFVEAAGSAGYSMISMECDPDGIRVDRQEADRITDP